MDEGEMKIVVVIKGNRASIGLRKPDCDPVFAAIEGDIPEILANIPRLVDQALATWQANPKYPKCETPLSPPPAPRPPPPAAHAPATKAQPAMF